jgi:7,8-dihydropterin-6-yl-methyl-4-(beta-D-ribofuranosyl)aminobenzene 5'-phosphate synthase
MRPLKTIDSLTLTVLVDDAAGPGPAKAEHGLAIWIDADRFRVLFDAGPGQLLEDNARQLGINLAEVDAVVLSHGHDDHTGGLFRVLSDCRKADLFFHPAALRERYIRSTGGAVRMCRFPLQAGDLLASRKDGIRWTSTVTHLNPAVFVTGEIPRGAPLEAPTNRFFRDPECTVPDPFNDEQALALETASGVVVILGCSHAGVENTIRCALSHSRSGKLRAVIGGMHLAEVSQDRLERLADYLQKLGPQLICPCHCTGGRAKEYFESRFPGVYRHVHTGTVLRLNGKSAHKASDGSPAAAGLTPRA